MGRRKISDFDRSIFEHLNNCASIFASTGVLWTNYIIFPLRGAANSVKVTFQSIKKQRVAVVQIADFKNQPVNTRAKLG